ncbi:MAG: hypothetical protein II918_00395 [Firmicutes bacterium]|nr:hypothetical protein [Bacillota bacterium]
MKKSLVKILSVLVIMVMVLGMLTACGGSNEGTSDEGNGEAAGVATVILVDEDGAEYTYELEAGKNLRDALHDAGLIDDDNFSKFMVETIDGHTALMDDGVLWMMADENKNQITGFFEEHVLAEGETLYLLYTVAPNFDD